MSHSSVVDWQVGDVIDSRYEVKELVGQGGMGTVYRVRHRDWNQDLAVKVPLPELVSDATAKERFIREAHTWVDLGVHPNIVQCWFVREHHGVPLLFLDYLPGGSLKEWKQAGRVSPGDWQTILDLTIQACDGLAHAHRYGVVHRDVKPANLLIREDGGLCVTDFGLVKMTGAEESPITIAREPLPDKLEEGVSLELSPKPGSEWSSWTLTRTGALLGTPEYSAPEQWEGRGVAVQADIYALGVLLFELCCGRRPFDDGTKRTEPSLLIARHMSKDPPNPREFRPDLPKNLDTVILQCLAKRPKERPPSMLDLRERLTFLYRTVVGKTYPRPIPKPGVQRAAALNNKAVSFWNLGKSQEAFSAWREASKLDALHPETVYNRSVLQWRLGQIRSTEVLHRLAQVKTAYPRAGVFLGLYYLEQFDPQAAEVELNAALELPHVASEGLAWRALGDARMYQARFTEAMQAYQAALRQIPDDHEALLRADLAAREQRIREGRILFPADSPRPIFMRGETVTALAFCPDGGLVAAIGDGLERISPEGHRQWRWQMSLLEGQGKSIRRLAVTESLVLSLESAGGRVWTLDRGRSLLALDERERFYTVLAGGHHALAGLIELRRLRLPDGTTEVVYSGHTKRVTSVAFLADESRFLSGSWDTTLRLWDAASGECLQVFEGHTDLVEAVGLTPDGELGLSGGRDRSLRFWSLATGGSLWVRPCAGEVRSIHFCAAGRYAAVGYGRSAEGGGVELWDVSTGERIFHREGSLVGLDPSGQFLLANIDATPAQVVLWEVPSGRSLRRLSGHQGPVTSLALSSDGNLAATGCQDGRLLMWEIAQGSRVYERALVVNRSRSHDESERTREVFWEHFTRARERFDRSDFATAYRELTQARSVFGYRRDPDALELNADLMTRLGRRSVAAVWQLRTVAEEVDISALTLTGDGRFAIAATGRFLRLWELATGSCLRGFTGHTGSIRRLALARDKGWLLSAGDDAVRLWDLETGNCINTYLDGHPGIEALAISSDGELAMAGTSDGLLLVWRLGQQAISERITATTADLAMTADGKLAVVVAPRQPMTVWNPREARCLLGGDTFGDKSMASLVTITDDGRYALTGGMDGRLRLWDLKKGRCLQELGPSGSGLTAITLVAGGLFALAASDDGQVRVYSVHGGGSLAQLEGHVGAVRALSATPDGRFVVTAGQDRSLRLWEIDWELDPEGQAMGLGQVPQGRFMQRLTAIFRKRT